jgi:hypothetical protein
MTAEADRLAGIVRSSPWLMRVLEAVRDVDVAFFDPHDLSRDNDDRVTARLGRRLPGLARRDGQSPLTLTIWRRVCRISTRSSASFMTTSIGL